MNKSFQYERDAAGMEHWKALELAHAAQRHLIISRRKSSIMMMTANVEWNMKGNIETSLNLL